MNFSARQVNIEKLIRLEVGTQAKIDLDTRKNRTPMSLVLDHAERKVGSCFDVWWIDNGPPTLSCLQQKDKAHVLFSTRFLEVSAQARSLFTDEITDKWDMAYRQAHLRIAEHSLALREPAMAVHAFCASVNNQKNWSLAGVDWHMLELQPIEEPYMALWFFGLLHEIGHLAYPSHGPEKGPNSKSVIEVVNHVLTLYDCPDEARASLQELSDEKVNANVLHPAVLAEEIYADLFAASILMSATQEIMQLVGREFDFIQLAFELSIVSHVSQMNAATASFARMLRDDKNKRQIALHALAQPVAATVRSIFLRLLLERAGIRLLNIEGDKKASREISGIFDDIADFVQPVALSINNAIGRAMRECISLQTEPEMVRMLPDIERQMNVSGIVNVPLIESTRSFCALAKSFGSTSPFIVELDALTTRWTRMSIRL
jgi:hypothetical protein